MTMTEAARETFLAERKTGIGGTDAAAILGVSPYKTPLQVYCEKTGILEEPDLAELERIQWGNKLEPYIAEAYAQRTGHEVRLTDGPVCHPEHPQIRANVDRAVFKGECQGVLECKNVSEWAAGEWEPEPPIHYQLQLQHYLMVTGATWGSFAALLGGNRLHIVDVERRDDLCELLLRKELEFWERVERRDPPPVGPLDRETLARMFPNHGLDEIALPEEFYEIDLELIQIKEEQKGHESRREELENRIKAAIGAHQAGRLPRGGSYTWKSQSRKVSCPKCEHVISDSTFRVLRRGK